MNELITLLPQTQSDGSPTLGVDLEEDGERAVHLLDLGGVVRLQQLRQHVRDLGQERPVLPTQLRQVFDRLLPDLAERRAAVSPGKGCGGYQDGNGPTGIPR